MRRMASKTKAAAGTTTSRWILALLLVLAACVGDDGSADVGARAFPEFALDDLRDRSKKLTFADDVRGRPTVVNFFASWCTPCKKELPVFADAYERHKHDVRFLGVDTEDSASEGLEMLERYGIDYPAVYDPDATVRNALGRSSGLPITAFVTSDGKVAKLVTGEMNRDELDDAIQELVEIGHEAAE